MWDTIRAYKHYCTIVLITHNMEEADALCERVGMISEGRMACVGRPSELKVIKRNKNKEEREGKGKKECLLIVTIGEIQCRILPHNPAQCH